MPFLLSCSFDRNSDQNDFCQQRTMNRAILKESRYHCPQPKSGLLLMVSSMEDAQAAHVFEMKYVIYLVSILFHVCQLYSMSKQETRSRLTNYATNNQPLWRPTRIRTLGSSQTSETARTISKAPSVANAARTSAERSSFCFVFGAPLTTKYASLCGSYCLNNALLRRGNGLLGQKGQYEMRYEI